MSNQNVLQYPRPDLASYTNCSNVSNSFNTVVTDERSQLLAWLSPLEPQNRHQDVRNRRVKGVGHWVLETDEFIRWRSGTSKNTALFCSGDPGVGKTYISSLVIDTLCDEIGDENAVVVCLYCDFLLQKEQSQTNMIGAILKQVVAKLEEIPEEINKKFRMEKGQIGGRGLSLPEILGMLKLALGSFDRVFICVDALDEFLVDYRLELIYALRCIMQEPGTRLFLAGRPHIQSELGKHLTPCLRILQIQPTKEDVIQFINTRLDRDLEADAMDDTLREDIMKNIPEAMSDIFLLVSLNMDAILGETTIHRRREKLKRMTNGQGLGDAYTATLERMKAQSGGKSRLGMTALMWISHAERPLQIDELRHALAIEIGSQDFNPDNIPSIRTLLCCCLGLVTIDEATSTVRLIHSTLQEFLCAHPNLFESTHSQIAEVSLTYLNFESVKNLPPTYYYAPPETPFLEYASCYWGVHARKEITECGKLLTLTLLEEYDSHISAKILLRKRSRLFLGDRGVATRKGFTGLHCTALFGMDEIANALKDKGGWDINASDSVDNTPLLWAAMGGHVRMVEFLLGWAGINPDKPDKHGQTPFSWAARRGYEEVVKLFLEKAHINVNTADHGGKTPLSWATRRGHLEVVKLFMKQSGVQLNKADDYGQTPLLWAVRYQYEEIIKLFLDQEDVNLNMADNFGQTPLSWAARRGYEGIVQLFLKRGDVDPNKADNGGKTPLSWATKRGHEGVVLLLLERADVNLDMADNCCQTPLLWAVRYERERTVKMLLERENINPNTGDNDGQTPLWWAAEKGNEEIVKLLLQRRDFNPNIAESDGQTPLSWAARRGHEGVVKLLLEEPDVNPNLADNDGQTPLWWAARWGNEGVVKLLLGREDVDTKAVDNEGRAPLWWAANMGHSEVVKLLSHQEGVSFVGKHERSISPQPSFAKRSRMF